MLVKLKMKIKKNIPLIDQHNKNGFWGGKFGGNFIPETLKKPVEDLEILFSVVHKKTGDRILVVDGKGSLYVTRIESENIQNGVRVILTNDIRWGRCDIKSIALLPNVLAKQEAIATGVSNYKIIT